MTATACNDHSDVHEHESLLFRRSAGKKVMHDSQEELERSSERSEAVRVDRRRTVDWGDATRTRLGYDVLMNMIA
jgi:hypothetical protein